MTISEIKKTKNISRYHLYVDDKFFGIFLDEILARYGLKTGQDIDESELKEIKKENDEKLAFDMALSYLEKYNVSSKSLKDYLKKKGMDKDAILHACEKLQEYGYINDENFAKAYFESLCSTKGKRAIANKLKEKGISQEIIDNLLSNVDDESEEERAYLSGVKFAKNRENNLKNKQKCLAHLIYKGYDYSVAQKVVNKIFTKENDDDWAWFGAYWKN